MLRLEPFTSDERSCPSPPRKGERDSRPRASRGREQRDTRPRPAMNPPSLKVKHLRPMAGPPLFRTFRRENPFFLAPRTYTNCSTTSTNCLLPASSPGISSCAKLGDLADGSSCRARTTPRYREAFVTASPRRPFSSVPELQNKDFDR